MSGDEADEDDAREARASEDEPPHDVLAAEEFGMGVADPALHEEPPHDVLAAEEFGMGVADPALHEEPAQDVLAAEEFGVGSRATELDAPLGRSATEPRRARARTALAVTAFAAFVTILRRKRRS